MAAITPYTDKLSGKSILVIGGTSGIGISVASLCLAHNAKVIISSSTDKKLSNALERLKTAYPKADISGYLCDLRASAVESSVKALFEKVGKVDHVVHTAGDSLAMTKLSEITVEKIQKAGEVRFVSVLIVAKYAAQYLKSGSASSLTLTSGIVAERPLAGWSIVSSYAGALYSTMRNLALDMKPVRVNLVVPGAVDTELWDSFSKSEKETFWESVKARVPTGQMGQPHDVAEAYLYVMRDQNVTGVTVKTDSGDTIV
jgi:NAD(P)-dependent dehydrogenase (short-subunit alcohol dehydrogenase family)